MKYFFYLFLYVSLVACHSKTSPESLTGQGIEYKETDTSIIFSILEGFKDSMITNYSNKKIDLMFNGIENYLDGKRYQNVNFRTECMLCADVQKINHELLFANRLLIKSNEIEYLKSDRNLPEDLGLVHLTYDKHTGDDLKLEFGEGFGSIINIGQSCMDADLYQVTLYYSSGKIIIDSLLNASFFEYDLDNNHQKEQYLLGSRNCSQELVLLRIRD